MLLCDHTIWRPVYQGGIFARLNKIHIYNETLVLHVKQKMQPFLIKQQNEAKQKAK